MNQKLFIAFISLSLLLVCLPLQAQVYFWQNYVPWPYDTLSFYSHETTVPILDSTLTQRRIYTINGSGHIDQVLGLANATGLDTLFNSYNFRDANDRDTFQVQYRFHSGIAYLASEIRSSYHPNGEPDSVIRVSYGSSPPFHPTLRRVEYFDSNGRIDSFFNYTWNNNNYKLVEYRLMKYQDSVQSDLWVYRDFGQLVTPILANHYFHFIDTDGVQKYYTHTARSHPDSSLSPSDSIHYFYDQQERLILSKTYRWTQSDQSWRLTSYDTTEFFSGVDDHLRTRFVLDDSVLVPYSRFREINTDSLYTRTTENWDKSCQCWWTSFKTHAFFDEWGRVTQNVSWNMSSPADTSYYNSTRNYFYGNHPFLRYRAHMTEYPQTGIKNKDTELYALGDSVLSSTADPIDFALILYPNPTSGTVNVYYPSGQHGYIRIFQADGRLLFEKSLSGNGFWQANLSHLPDGQYFAEVRMGEKRGIRRFVLMR